MSRTGMYRPGGKGGTILQAPNHYEGVESLPGRRKVLTMLHVLSSMQFVCIRKTSGSNMGSPNLLLAADAI